MNLWATAAQAVVYSAVSITFGLLYKRALKRDRERLERIITGVETVFGITATPEITVKETVMDIIARYRKAVAAGLGVLVTGVLTWASTDGVLAAILEPVVPDAFKPLIGVVVGGIATVLAVIRTANTTTTDTDAGEVAATVAAVPAVSTSPTSIVSLLPAPDPSYL